MPALVREDVELAAARPDLLQIRLQLLDQGIGGRHRDDRHVAVNQRERPMLELARGIGLGMDIGDFLELERAFHRDRPVDAAAEKQRVLLRRKARGPGSHLRLGREHLVHCRGQVAQGVQMAAFGRRIEAAAQARDHERKQKQRGELGGERLGGSDADLGAGARQVAQARSAHQRAFGHVADRERRPIAERFGVLEGGERVGRFAGLRDGDEQPLRIGHRAPIAVFARDLGARRDAGNVFEPVAADERRVVARAAGDDVHRARGAQHAFGLGAEQAGLQRACARHDLERIREGPGLLVDLLLHVMAIGA